MKGDPQPRDGPSRDGGSTRRRLTVCRLRSHETGLDGKSGTSGKEGGGETGRCLFNIVVGWYSENSLYRGQKGCKMNKALQAL